MCMVLKNRLIALHLPVTMIGHHTERAITTGIGARWLTVFILISTQCLYRIGDRATPKLSNSAFRLKIRFFFATAWSFLLNLLTFCTHMPLSLFTYFNPNLYHRLKAENLYFQTLKTGVCAYYIICAN